jgi:hypothetical protein
MPSVFSYQSLAGQRTAKSKTCDPLKPVSPLRSETGNPKSSASSSQGNQRLPLTLRPAANNIFTGKKFSTKKLKTRENFEK